MTLDYRWQRIARFACLVMLAMVIGTGSRESRLVAQQPTQALSAQAISQINGLIAEKAARTPAQMKMASDLVYAAKMARNEPVAAGVSSLQVDVARVSALDSRVVVDVRTEVTDSLLAQLQVLGGELLDVSEPYRNVRLRIDLQQVEAVAGLPEVTYVQPKQEGMTSRVERPGAEPWRSTVGALSELRRQKRLQRADTIGAVQQALEGGDGITSVGSINSQGDTTHRAAAARATYGVSGAGLRIGVLSDGVAHLAQSQTLGDLGTVTVLAGQAGTGDEGTAMLEIVHDLAPDAQLYFATANTSLATFATNIRALRNAGCDIIVDDFLYFAESPFQDGQTYTSPSNGGILAQAVKDVVASGALYFAAAANNGNKNDGTSGTWEGDFVDAGDGVNSFGGQPYDVLTISPANAYPITLFWSDPLGASGNDYDLFRLSTDGATVLSASTNTQSGTQDPFEAVTAGTVGQRIVVLRRSGSARFLHLSTNRNRLTVSTAGETHGHAATTAPNSFGVAATPAQTPGPYPNPFNSNNKVETFSSDGPRRIFFAGNGVPFSPGSFLSNGGIVLQKPDFAAADGVSITGVGPFSNPFFGTSAAAPHAAAIAALVKSRNPGQTGTQVRTALFRSAIDIEGAGVDRDSGIGIIMADAAVAAVANRQRGDGDLDGDGRADLTIFRPSSSTWWTLGSNANYSTSNAVPWGVAGDIPVPGDYDGDGRADLAIFRPASGTWWVLTSSSNYSAYLSYAWGISGDIPVPADYDGDGKSDIATYRPSTGTWWVLTSSTNFTSFVAFTWGTGNDVPVPRDYDGDGKADYAIYRPGTGTWWLALSATNTTSSVQWGTAGDVPVAADYDGDGKADLAVYRPASANWYVLQSSTNNATFLNYLWGGGADVPVPADYDGDGKVDVATYRPSTGTWWIIRSATNTPVNYNWGTGGDVPVLTRP